MAPQNHEATLQSFLSRANYRNLASTKRDILSALNHYRGLVPKLEKFSFNDGRTRDLVCLKGTIPVTYRGNTYNIPVGFWILVNFLQWNMKEFRYKLYHWFCSQWIWVDNLEWSATHLVIVIKQWLSVFVATVSSVESLLKVKLIYAFSPFTLNDYFIYFTKNNNIFRL